MSNIPLPCPFCGGKPSIDPIGRLRCTTFGCPTAYCWNDQRSWNTRAPVAEPAGTNERHPHADVARLCIVNARRLLDNVLRHDDRDARHLECGDRYLRQALDALRPTAAPVSVAFWLGMEAS